MIWMVYNSRNLFSRGSEGWKSNIKVSARLVPIQGFEGTSVPDSSSSFWGIVSDFGVPWLVYCPDLCYVI